MFAHYIKTHTGSWVHITPTNRPVNAVLIERVSGKAGARKVAKRENATPANF